MVAIIDYAANYSMRQRKTKVNMFLLCKPANSRNIQPDIQGKYTEMILLRDSFIQLKKIIEIQPINKIIVIINAYAISC